MNCRGSVLGKLGNLPDNVDGGTVGRSGGGGEGKGGRKRWREKKRESHKESQRDSEWERGSEIYLKYNILTAYIYSFFI